MTPAPQYIITEEEMRGIFVYLKNSGLHVQAMPINMIFDKVRSHPLPPHSIKPKGCLCEYCEETTLECKERHNRQYSASSDVLEQCETCYFKGTRACAYHGYPTDVIGKFCRYKVGVDAQFALDNLAGTFIIKNLRQQTKEQMRTKEREN
jgi:hypothetical protein